MMYHKVFANSKKTTFVYIINNYIIKTADIDKNKSQLIKIYQISKKQISRKNLCRIFYDISSKQP